MPGYMVYWPQDRVRELQRAGDAGPIRVVLGSVHSRMPSIASVREGDVVFPVTLIQKQLYVMARLPVEHREPALDYCLRELGLPYGALLTEGVALEHQGRKHFYSCRKDGTVKYYDRPEDLPEGIRLVPLSEQVEKPHLLHQEPFNCCSQWAAWGDHGSGIAPRLIPPELVPGLRFGHPKSKEKGLRLDQSGGILAMSLQSTRRMSPETLAVFEALFAGEAQPPGAE